MQNKHKLALAMPVFSLILGSIFSYLFITEGLGLNVPIFLGTFFWIFIALKLMRKGTTSLNRFDFLFVLLLVLSLSFVWHRTPSLLLVNFFVIVGSIIPVSYFSLYPKKFKIFSYFSGLFAYLHNSFSGLISFPGFVMDFIGALNKLSAGKVPNRRYILNALLGVAIALPIVLLFGILLASADDAFGNLFDGHNLDISFSKIVVTLLVASGTLYMLLGMFASKLEILFLKESENTPTSSKQGVSSITTAIVLGSINLLFLIFIVVQFVYLFGDHDKVVDLGLTYSEYAVNGFWELQFIALLSLGLMYLLTMFTKLETRKAKIVIRTLISIFVVNILIIIFSAHTRMSLYENGYGLTHLRLYTHVFMGFEAILFVYLLAGNFFEKIFKQFSLFSFVLGLVFLFGLNIVVPDKIIARRNIERYVSGETNLDLDYYYLLELSSDAYLQLENVEFDEKEAFYEKLSDDIDFYSGRYDSWKEFNRADEHRETKAQKILDAQN